MPRLGAVAILWLLASCTSPVIPPGPDRLPDAGTQPVGPSDAGAGDAGLFDAGAFDAGVVDAGVFDAGAVDAGAFDAGAFDSGQPDAGIPDSGVADAGDFVPPTFTIVVMEPVYPAQWDLRSWDPNLPAI